MITVYVKHYLTVEGQKYLKNTWFESVKNIISKQPGYISIKHDVQKDNDDCINIIVKFANEATLEDWVKHPAHDPFVNNLDQYRSRNYWEVARTKNEEVIFSELNWEKIKSKW